MATKIVYEDVFVSTSTANKSSQPKANKKKKHTKKFKTTDSSLNVDLSVAEFEPAALLPIYEGRLDDAKALKDFEAQKTVRVKLWMLNDMSSGAKRPDLPSEELIELLSSIPVGWRYKTMWLTKEEIELLSLANINSPPKPNDTETIVNSALSPTDKRRRAIQKKLGQIRLLKEKRDSGEILEANQITKIQTEKSLQMELSQLDS